MNGHSCLIISFVYCEIWKIPQKAVQLKCVFRSIFLSFFRFGLSLCVCVLFSIHLTSRFSFSFDLAIFIKLYQVYWNAINKRIQAKQKIKTEWTSRASQPLMNEGIKNYFYVKWVWSDEEKLCRFPSWNAECAIVNQTRSHTRKSDKKKIIIMCKLLVWEIQWKCRVFCV